LSIKYLQPEKHFFPNSPGVLYNQLQKNQKIFFKMH